MRFPRRNKCNKHVFHLFFKGRTHMYDTYCVNEYDICMGIRCYYLVYVIYILNIYNIVRSAGKKCIKF